MEGVIMRKDNSINIIVITRFYLQQKATC